VNDFRRELNVEIAGKSFLLKGSFDCMSAMQSASGKMISEITNDLATGKFPVDSIPAIIYGGIVGAGNKEGLTLEKVKDLCFDHGLVGLVPMVTKFFLLCISKNPNYSGDAPKNEVAGEPAQ
jgi:hypothetical protein